MGYRLRLASEDDAPNIKGLVYAARINPTGLDWRRFTVAISPSGEMIGCVQIKPHRDGSRELASLVVAPAWRGQGVARLLVEQFISAHPGRLYLTCRAGLGGFYKKFGFRVAAETEMTPYFRRLSRLAKVIGFIGLEQEGLLVMVRDV
jgi:amino-acid N-acetyltransferase